MLFKVLKPFPYAHDHVNVVSLGEGDLVEIDSAVAEGLHDEGFIEEPSEAELAAAGAGPDSSAELVEIPADWAGLHWFKLKALAERLSGGPVENKLQAMPIIQAEADRRAAA